MDSQKNDEDIFWSGLGRSNKIKSKQRVDSGWLFFTERPNCFVPLEFSGYCKVIRRIQRQQQARKQVYDIKIEEYVYRLQDPGYTEKVNRATQKTPRLY
jgi:hypothetical protein